MSTGINATPLPAGRPERRKLDQLRAQIAALGDARDEIRGAPPPVAEAIQMLLATLAPDVERARQALLGLGSGGGYSLPPVDSWVMNALLYPQEFTQQVTAVLEADPRKRGLAADERRKKVAELEQKIVALELAEETEIIRLEVLNCCVERRPEVPISRLFEVWDAA